MSWNAAAKTREIFLAVLADRQLSRRDWLSSRQFLPQHSGGVSDDYYKRYDHRRPNDLPTASNFFLRADDLELIARSRAMRCDSGRVVYSVGAAAICFARWVGERARSFLGVWIFARHYTGSED